MHEAEGVQWLYSVFWIHLNNRLENNNAAGVARRSCRPQPGMHHSAWAADSSEILFYLISGAILTLSLSSICDVQCTLGIFNCWIFAWQWLNFITSSFSLNIFVRSHAPKLVAVHFGENSDGVLQEWVLKCKLSQHFFWFPHFKFNWFSDRAYIPWVYGLTQEPSQEIFTFYSTT